MKEHDDFDDLPYDLQMELRQDVHRIYSRHGASNGNDVFVKKSTLGQITRIERLRWRALEIRSRLFDRWNKLKKSIVRYGGDCFIPTDAPMIHRRRTEDDGRPIYPRRVVVERCDQYERDGTSSHYDDDYWRYEEPKHNASNEMEVIAAAVSLGEWEQIELPRRKVRATDARRLNLGRRWRHFERREVSLRDRIGFIEALLADGIRMARVLPKTQPYLNEVISVVVNGRRYPFTVRGDYAEPTEWPRIESPSDVVIPERFVLDESLVGKSKTAVMVRLGDQFVSNADGTIWFFREGTITFKKSLYYEEGGIALSVDTTPNSDDMLSEKARLLEEERASERKVKKRAQGRKGSTDGKKGTRHRQAVDGKSSARGKAKGPRACAASQAS